ncbi:MAG: hypothetical protein C4293_07840, partial [Nitrospiraceae bacterium]
MFDCGFNVRARLNSLNKDCVAMTFITDRDIEFMQMALDTARSAPAIGEVPIAAVIVLDGQVLAQVAAVALRRTVEQAELMG